VANDQRKYFFDANNFDSPHNRDQDPDLQPPPPVFSLEELGVAKEESFSSGRLQGLEEARLSREQYIAAQVSGIREQIISLILAEQIREKKYEEDVLSLCRAMFVRIFPSLSARHSIDEILDVVRNVLSTQDHSHILIEVPSADEAEITTHLGILLEAEKDRIKIAGNDALGAGTCRMKWENGGAMRDQAAVVDAVMAEIEDLLAPKTQKSQNNESEAPESKGEGQ